jgi:hypothetical protein
VAYPSLEKADGAYVAHPLVNRLKVVWLSRGRSDRDSKESLKKGFWVLDISGSLLRAIAHPRPVQRTRGVAQPP